MTSLRDLGYGIYLFTSNYYYITPIVIFGLFFIAPTLRLPLGSFYFIRTTQIDLFRQQREQINAYLQTLQDLSATIIQNHRRQIIDNLEAVRDECFRFLHEPEVYRQITDHQYLWLAYDIERLNWAISWYSGTNSYLIQEVCKLCF